ncbi:unnamed protein product [Sympodiomycopsis kandeliae]
MLPYDASMSLSSEEDQDGKPVWIDGLSVGPFRHFKTASGCSLGDASAAPQGRINSLTTSWSHKTSLARVLFYLRLVSCSKMIDSLAYCYLDLSRSVYYIGLVLSLAAILGGETSHRMQRGATIDVPTDNLWTGTYLPLFSPELLSFWTMSCG